MKPRFAPSGAPFSLGQSAMSAPVSLVAAPLVLVERPNVEPSQTTRRAKIWELSRYLHCSIVGTCLSTSDLRHILTKAGFATDGATDHELHGQGVTVAGQRDVAGKLLHKALDKRHQRAINQVAKARGSGELSALWREALSRGDIPGAYWGTLTHPEVSDDLVRQMFGEVHMLSHLVGAANRADIRRLTELEAENASLREKLRRQEAHLREGISSRDSTIRDLNLLLVRKIAEPDNLSSSSSEQSALTALVADLERRLGAESRRRATVEQRLEQAGENVRQAQTEGLAAQDRAQALREELEALEASLIAPGEIGYQPEQSERFEGLSVLYVGGRPHQQSHLRTLTTSLGIDLLFHDGGIDDRHGLLAGMISRSDIVMFPVDCVSHEAMSAVKRLCRKAGKSFVPLRSGGLSSFLAALRRVPLSHATSDDAVTV